MIRVCQHCHCDPCQCPSDSQLLLFMVPFMVGCIGGIAVGQSASGLEGHDLDSMPYVIAGCCIGGFVGLIVGFGLLLKFQGKN